MIGQFWSLSTKIVQDSFMTVKLRVSCLFQNDLCM